MSKQTINIGASPNDGTGTPLRTSFDYTNQNFTELYTAVGPSGNNIVVPGTATITGDLDVSGNGAFIGIGRVGLQRPFIPTGQNGTTTLDYRWYSTGTTYVTGARIRASSEAAWSSVSAPTRLMFETVPSGAVALSERYRISGDGLHTWSNVNNVGGTQMTLDGTGLIVTGATITGAATVGTTLGVTGNLTVDTNTLFVNSSNDRVGIGTVSPNNTLTVRGSQDAGIEINSADSNMSRLIFAYDPANTRWYINSTLSGSGTTIPLAFLIQNSEVARFNTTGNLAFVTGKGIDFSAVTGGTGTATANVLNDYEEGTFLPTVFGSTIAGVAAYTTRTGRYTKIGNLVSVQVYINWSAIVGGTGDLRFGGLPFTSSSDASVFGAVTFGYTAISLTANNVLVGYISSNQTNIEAQQYPVGGGSITNVPIDTASEVIYSLTYRV